MQGDVENGHCNVKDAQTIQQQNGSSSQNQRRNSLLSSLFSSPSSPTSSSLYSDEAEEEKPIKSTPSPDKSHHGFFSSVWNRNYGLLSELSSKFEAALHVSLDALDSEVDSGSEGKSHGSSSVQDADMKDAAERARKYGFRKQRSQSHQMKKQRSRTCIPPKDRSVYGQPEVELATSKWYTKKERSCDSLDTVDSSQSQGYSSASLEQMQQTSPGKQDPFYVFRHNDSLGIGSESDTCGPSTSLDSSDAESVPGGRGLGAGGRSGSGESLQSWTSTYSCDSQVDETSAEVMEFMKSFVKKIFTNSSSITLEEKSKFGEFSRQEIGRLWFARCVNAQRVHSKKVNESTFYSLVQYFAIILFECAEADDFSPAKSIMNMCFTFYLEVCKENQSPSKEYLYLYLKSQPIWHSLRFWNAAFFDAVQCERARRPTPTREEVNAYSPDDVQDEMCFQENITFGQLGTFTYNMHSFGLSKEFCLEFLRKQCTIANLRKDQVCLLRENIEQMYCKDPI